MTATNETFLPTYEDLYVPPLNLTSAGLKAGAFYFTQFCDLESKEFMLCKNEEGDPRKCLEYNKKLSLCSNEFFRKVKDNCAETFTDYWKCLDKSQDGQMSYKFCRKTQEAFDACMKEKMNLSRPEVGFLSRVRLFESSRPKPVDVPKQYAKLAEMPSLSEVPEAEDSMKKTNKRIY